MEYFVNGKSSSNGQADFAIRQSEISFGIAGDEKELPNPAELLLGAFAACCLKNVERFSKILKFHYETAQIEVKAERQNAPSKITSIHYIIQIKSDDERLNVKLLHKNIKKHGTIYNTLKAACTISGDIQIV